MRREEIEKKSPARDASALHVGIVVSNFNRDITDALLAGAYETFAEWGVKKENIAVRHVPGAFEIPLGCVQMLRANPKPDAIVALGCVLKGETKHDEYIAGAVSQGIMDIMLAQQTPIAFGVLTPNTLEQAHARSRGEANHGAHAAATALEMALS